MSAQTSAIAQPTAGLSLRAALWHGFITRRDLADIAARCRLCTRPPACTTLRKTSVTDAADACGNAPLLSELHRMLRPEI